MQPALKLESPFGVLVNRLQWMEEIEEVPLRKHFIGDGERERERENERENKRGKRSPPRFLSFL